MIGKIIDKYSSFNVLDKVKLFKIVLFSYVTLNSDMHLKNFSLFEQENNRLTPCYDLLPAKLFVDDKDELALTINGKNRNLTRNDFLKFGYNLGIDKKVLEKCISELFDKKSLFLNIIEQSDLSSEFKDNYKSGLILNIEKLNAK